MTELQQPQDTFLLAYRALHVSSVVEPFDGRRHQREGAMNASGSAHIVTRKIWVLLKRPLNVKNKPLHAIFGPEITAVL